MKVLCNCWTCGAKGHISTDCPDNQRRGIRQFEATPEFEDAVYYQDLVQGDLNPPSDESIYEEEEIDSENGSESSSESESRRIPSANREGRHVGIPFPYDSVS